ncbi:GASTRULATION DEFECTIVE PROTEIN 1-RELATED [Salix viminalis]|uniref:GASTRULATION DEFECTIVE PROTEIN 1-RELATED n=1 Tax=Salix viminalis TaxID=40686 RepID=A0A9Q0NR48_SALVM|nr:GASTRULATION DEFECTIVE PROTEIN 1-RELATED [Salix viminalis]
MEEEEAEVYDGVRAQFPLTFGKQSKSQTPLEKIHNTTIRKAPPTSAANAEAQSTSFPSLSSSSKAGLDSLPHVSIGPPRPQARDVDEEEDGEVMVGPPRPPLGLVDDDDDDEDGVMIGPLRPPAPADSDEEDLLYRIPTSNEIVLGGHSKVVSALAVDHTGSRVLSGSYDYSVRMYDFQGMNSRLQSFRQLEPFEGHQVRNLSWSPSADRFLCVSGSAQAKIYDRDGLTLVNEAVLAAVRCILAYFLLRPGRVPVTTCAWDREGKRIAGGIGDGSIQIWSLKPGWGSRPDVFVEKAHSEDITCLKFSSDGQILLSRSFDCSLKVWDLRQMKEVLKVFENLPNNYAQTNIAFSPDEQLFLTGTSFERESKTGGVLCFYNRAKLELVSRVGISPTFSVVRCAWHPKLNQIFATAGDKKPRRNPCFGGRVGVSKGSLLTQYLLKQGGMIKETWMEEDPREAILKYADAAEKDPKYIAPAYAQTQPDPVFAKSDSEDEEK